MLAGWLPSHAEAGLVRDLRSTDLLVFVSTFSHDKAAAFTRYGDHMMDRSTATNESLWESPYPAMGKKVPPAVSDSSLRDRRGNRWSDDRLPVSKEGRKVLVLEGREIGGGQTSKTTAHLASALSMGRLDRARNDHRSRKARASTPNRLEVSHGLTETPTVY
jgi:hypothetical protein